jgi:hypothetical protein
VRAPSYLSRNLTPAQEASAIFRRKAIYEELHAETTWRERRHRGALECNGKLGYCIQNGPRVVRQFIQNATAETGSNDISDRRRSRTSWNDRIKRC